ncbi:MAG: malate synthase A, partial [bacterium]
MTHQALPIVRDRRAPEGFEILGAVTAEYAEILNPEALLFVALLERRFREAREILLERRQGVQDALD